MQIVARLGVKLLTRLRAVVDGTDVVVLPVATWPAVVDAVREQPVDVVVVDPCADSGPAPADAITAIRALRMAAPVLSVLVYTGVSAESMRAMQSLYDFGVRHMILEGFDDHPRRFRDRLAEFRVPGLEERVLSWIVPLLTGSDAPPRLADALTRLFRDPVDFRDSEDFARAAGLSRRHLNRWLEKVGLASARTMVMAARVLRGYQYAQNPGFSTGDIAQRLRYPDWRVFHEHVRAITGRTPAAWRQDVSPDECVAQLCTRLRTHAPAAPDGVLSLHAYG